MAKDSFKLRRAGIFILAFLLSFILIVGAVFVFFGNMQEMLRFKSFLKFGDIRNVTANAAQSTEPEITPSPAIEKQFEYATIAAVGDILIHLAQLPAQYDPATDTYNFNNNFKYVKKYIESADIALANFETTLAGPEWGDYVGYPLFNSPDSLVDALKNAGFDMVSTANNHMYDAGDFGFFRTGRVLREKGVDVLGTRTDLSQKNYIIKVVNGIRIGFSNFGYETDKQGNTKSLNGIPLSEKASELINTFDYNMLEPGYAAMKKCVDNMRADGAEFIIMVMHWGNEYETVENAYETEIAQKLADFGVDAVIGGHPHVLQPIKSVWSDVSGKNMLVAYSMGNFISNQRYEVMEQRYSEDGMIINLNIKKDLIKNIVVVDSVTYTPTWVDLYYTGGKPVYEILPDRDALANPDEYNLNISPNAAWRVENSILDTTGIINPAVALVTAFKIIEYSKSK